jgi:plastocyanin
MRKLAPLIAVLALAALGLAACGSSSDTTSSTSTSTAAASTSTTASGGSGGTISIEADPSGALAFTKTSVSAPAGSDTLDFNNPASLGHDVVIEDSGGNEVARTDVITGDSTSTTADLKAGTYTFFCSVDGHRDAGMEGTLTVK